MRVNSSASIMDSHYMKDNTISGLIDHFQELFGKEGLAVRDHWEGDLCATGFVGPVEERLIYVSSYNRDPGFFYVVLEDISDPEKYNVLQTYENESLQSLEDLIRRHLLGENQ